MADSDTQINNEIAVGHQRIHDVLSTEHGEPMLHICHNCPNMIQAFEIYSWLQKDLDDLFSTKERPDDAGKDPIDTLRYLLDYGPSYSEGHSGSSPEEEDHGETGYGDMF